MRQPRRLLRILCCWAGIAGVSAPALADGRFERIDGHPGQRVPEALLTTVAVDLSDVPLTEALALVSDQGGFSLNYSLDRIPAEERVSVRMEGVPALEVLLAITEETGTELLATGSGQLAIVPKRAGPVQTGAVRGLVIDKETRRPLFGTNIVIIGTRWGGSSRRDGEYLISDLPPGAYDVDFSYIGYRTEHVRGMQILPESSTELDVELEPQPIPLDQVIVTPGQFSVMGGEPTVRQTLTRQDLETIPLGEDIYRAVTRLPGVTSNDFSARFTVRGGRNEDVLVLMDGQELYEPFHLKDVDGGVLSIVDVESIESIHLYAGGYPAEYGECLSGVLDMTSRHPRGEHPRTTLGISLMNARIMSEGTFDGGAGTWLVSARRGYIDLVLGMMGEKDAPEPFYYDAFGKVRFQVDDRNTISAHVLHSGDRLQFEEEMGDRVSTEYENSYGWLTWNSMLNPRLLLRTTASFGRIVHSRKGVGYPEAEGDMDFSVVDDTGVNLSGLKQDWDLEPADRWRLKWGYFYKSENADYDYLSTRSFLDWSDPGSTVFIADTTRVRLQPGGSRRGAYVSSRVRIVSPLTAEAGLRFDAPSSSGGRYLDPRLGIVYALGRQTFLRAGWGYFHQCPRINEIGVAYGETDYPSIQRAEHWVAGMERTFGNGLDLRLEGYYRKTSDPRPDHRTFSNEIEVFPEVEEDVFTLTFDRAESKGLELYAKYHQEGKWSCWGSYALAEAHEDVRSLTYRGDTSRLADPRIPALTDQRHTIYLNANYRPSRRWDLNVSWNYHSGRPHTRRLMRSRELPDGSTQYYLEYGPLLGARLPAYHRMDLQFNRHFFLSGGRLSVSLALLNLYNRSNLRNIKYSWKKKPDGSSYLEEREEYWFPLLPSLGVSWTW